ncbi:MAG: acireductone synthase, partial [Acidobacteria bacterium]|nr:acireductone synthase [Acidobacteriota bacterium]
SHVFADVPPALARWRRQGKDIAIFSSGSVLAQKLLFAHTDAGDLTGFIRAYFDTTIGPKTDPASYGRIATALGLPSEKILFVSDTPAELEAAGQAGLACALCARSGAPPGPGELGTKVQLVIQSFAELG